MYTTLVTLRLPVVALPPTLMQRVQTLCTLTEAAPARLTAALRTVVAATLDQLVATRAAVEEALGATGVAWQRQDGVGLAAVLARALAPLAPEIPVFQPDVPLRHQGLTTPATQVPGGWQLGNETAHVLSLWRAPLQTFPGMLAASRTPLGVRPLTQPFQYGHLCARSLAVATCFPF